MTLHELRAVIILHVLAASYSLPVSTIASPQNSEFFFQFGVSTERYNDVWTSLSCTKDKRQRVEYSETGWSNKPTRGNSLITELEQEFAAVNRSLLYIAGATIFSLDDDHQRLSSRAVTEFTQFSHVNNPQKALGPVNNALCGSLNPVFLASHYSRPREQLIHIWQRLIQLVQGVPTSGAIAPMTDAIFAADRGYNSKQTIAFLNERLCATGIGTHKRSVDYPFVFGDGPVSKKHKGMVVSEKGCRAVYSAVRKADKNSGRAVEAAVYRESYSGRIAAVYHNSESKFSAYKFTLVPKEGFRGGLNDSKVKEIQVLFTRKGESRARRITSLSNPPTEGAGFSEHLITNECRMKVDNILGNVNQLTLLQSEDPGWFLARAFMFTSRTSHGFMRAFSGNYEANLAGMSFSLTGKVVSRLTNPLSQDIGEVEQKLNGHWLTVLDLCNIRKRDTECNGANDAAETIMAISQNDLNDIRKDDILNLLSKVGKRASSSLRKPQLVQRVLDLQTQVSNGTEALQLDASEELSVEEKSQKRAKALDSSMYMASLESWVMKPLTATAGMKEGTINEVQVLNALPAFFDDNDVVAWTPQLSTSLKDGISVPKQNLTVHHVKRVGLLSSNSIEMVADSPDGLLGISNEEGQTFCAAVEIKTMASPRTVEQARKVAEKFGAFIELKDIGILDANKEGFHNLVPKTEYRLQCIHHAVALGLKKVLFVVAKGSSMGIGSIIYSVLLNLSEGIRSSYSFCLDCIRLSSFKWVGADSSMIPKESDNMLQSSHAYDLYSFSSFYSLSRAYRGLVCKTGPLPPARIVGKRLFGLA